MLYNINNNISHLHHNLDTKILCNFHQINNIKVFHKCLINNNNKYINQEDNLSKYHQIVYYINNNNHKVIFKDIIHYKQPIKINNINNRIK